MEPRRLAGPFVFPSIGKRFFYINGTGLPEMSGQVSPHGGPPAAELVSG